MMRHASVAIAIALSGCMVQPEGADEELTGAEAQHLWEETPALSVTEGVGVAPASPPVSGGAPWLAGEEGPAKPTPDPWGGSNGANVQDDGAQRPTPDPWRPSPDPRQEESSGGATTVSAAKRAR